ncbi:MAG: CvpA family protein [Phycisphaerales bacterium]|nr:CvpA family protein [Planctomycetota bacterium]
MNESTPQSERPPPLSRLRAGLMVGVGAVALACLVFGSLPVKVVAVVLAVCVIQGLWRGAAELVGLVIGMVLGVALCRPLGRLFEPLFAGIAGTRGLSSRLLSTGIAAVFVSIIAAGIIGFAAKRMMKKRPELAGADKLAGGGLGLIEGCFLGLVLLWVPLAMEPVARGQLNTGDSSGKDKANPVAAAVVQFAEEVKSSSLGNVAERTNPIEGSRVFSLAADFAIVMRNPRAREHFVTSPAMKALRETPSLQSAIAKLEQDPELGALIRAGDYGPDFLKSVFTSRGLVDVLDNTTIVRDLTPQVGAIESALQEAKQIALQSR